MASRRDKSAEGTLPRPARHRPPRLASWIVVTTLFLNILSAIAFPSMASGAVSNAFPRTENGDVLVICTPNGLKFIRLGANGEPAPTKNIDDGYCAFCQPFSHPILSTPATATVTSAYDYTVIQLPVSCEADQSVATFSHSPLGSRAPPVSSI